MAGTEEFEHRFDLLEQVVANLTELESLQKQGSAAPSSNDSNLSLQKPGSSGIVELTFEYDAVGAQGKERKRKVLYRNALSMRVIDKLYGRTKKSRKCQTDGRNRNPVKYTQTEEVQGPETSQPPSAEAKVPVPEPIQPNINPATLENQKRALKCGYVYCTMEFEDFQEFRVHVNTHLGQKNQCNWCARTFQSQWSVRRHVSAVSACPGRIVAETLGADLPNRVRRSSFSQSQLGENSTSSAPALEPEVPLRAMTLPSRALAHSQPEPLNEPLYLSIQKPEVPKQRINGGSCLCLVCGKKFLSEIALENHMPLHSIERKFPCGNCTYRFATKKDVIRHMGRNSCGNSPTL